MADATAAAAPPAAPPPLPAPTAPAVSGDDGSKGAERGVMAVAGFGLAVIVLLFFCIVAAFWIVGRTAGQFFRSLAKIFGGGAAGAECVEDLTQRANAAMAAGSDRCAAYRLAAEGAAGRGKCPPSAGSGPAWASPPYRAYMRQVGCLGSL